MGPSVFCIKMEFRKKNTSQNGTEKHYLKLCWLPFLHSRFPLLSASETEPRQLTKFGLQHHRYNIPTHFQVLSLIQSFRQFLYLFLGSDEDSYLQESKLAPTNKKSRKQAKGKFSKMINFAQKRLNIFQDWRTSCTLVVFQGVSKRNHRWQQQTFTRQNGIILSSYS